MFCRSALTVNTLGTLKVVNLCRKLPNLKCLVHVSTAYSNCDLEYIEESVYPSQISPHMLMHALKLVAFRVLSPVQKLQPLLPIWGGGVEFEECSFHFSLGWL